MARARSRICVKARAIGRWKLPRRLISVVKEDFCGRPKCAMARAFAAKRATGTMCPSFMATGDEEHSTRGRANALRLVLVRRLCRRANSPAESCYDTFDLCLQCKGCKAECPSNVDVAKMKAEFLHQYHAEHGVPLGARMMADVARLNRWGSALAPLSNWMRQVPGAAMLLQRIAGIDRSPAVAAIRAQSFSPLVSPACKSKRASRPRLQARPDRAAGRLPDELLRAAGESSRRRRAGSGRLRSPFGRPGMLRPGRDFARAARRSATFGAAKYRTALALGRAWRADRRLRTELLTDTRGRLSRPRAWRRCTARRRRRVAYRNASGPLRRDCRRSAARMPNAILAASTAIAIKRRSSAWPTRWPTDKRSRHRADACRQRLLRNGRLVRLRALRPEHEDRRAGVIPGRAPAADAIICPGFSCRHQIEHGTGRQAVHPIEIIKI